MYRLSYLYPHGFSARKVLSQQTLGLLADAEKYIRLTPPPPIETAFPKAEQRAFGYFFQKKYIKKTISKWTVCL
jgi:hypothetical protein